MNNLQRVLAVVTGLLILAGSVAAWHYWHIDGFVAFVIGGAGLAAIGAGVGVDLSC